MPFKHNVARHHRIPKARRRIQNWSAYEAGLKRRGDLTFWLDEAAIAGWQALRRSTPGGQAWYSDAAIELVLMLRLVFHLALRQAEGFATSVPRLLRHSLRVPDHTTLSRRSRSFAGRQPRMVPNGPLQEARPDAPLLAQAAPRRRCRNRRDRRLRADRQRRR